MINLLDQGPWEEEGYAFWTSQNAWFAGPISDAWNNIYGGIKDCTCNLVYLLTVLKIDPGFAKLVGSPTTLF